MITLKNFITNISIKSYSAIDLNIDIGYKTVSIRCYPDRLLKDGGAIQRYGSRYFDTHDYDLFYSIKDIIVDSISPGYDNMLQMKAHLREGSSASYIALEK